MADPLSLIASIASLSRLARLVAQSLEHFHAKRDKDRQFELQAVKLRLALVLEKLKAWQENWYGNGQMAKPPPPETLWGHQGSATISALIHRIIRQSKEIERLLQKVEIKRENHPRSRWQQAVESIGKQRRSANLHMLHEHTERLNDYVDELWLSSDTVFDSLHGLLAAEPKPAGRDILLRSALYSRAGTLKLYRLCSEQTADCNLEMDLSKPIGSRMIFDYESLDDCAIYYRLVTEVSAQRLQKMVVENLVGPGVSTDTPTTTPESKDANLQLFRPRSGLQTIRVPQQGSSTPNLLRLSGVPGKVVQLTSNPASLEDVLNGVGNTRLSLRGRIKLAFKLTESALFLLGTPWFSSLTSKNLRQLPDTGFMLRTPTLDLKDLISDDPSALTEATQLFRLGVLLMEIALGTEKTHTTPEDAVETDHDTSEPSRLSKLPLVEKTMGSQYCRATAFCLLHRKEKFSGADKYNDKSYPDWEKYLVEILDDFHSQVFLRQVRMHVGRAVL
ncbi:MAG: hypothetical protein L6R39_003133 [Caloplaca ligustica]|nr:MAG: hypothetical protein L6R39_003133 [Caloplaca ligustica]